MKDAVFGGDEAEEPKTPTKVAQDGLRRRQGPVDEDARGGGFGCARDIRPRWRRGAGPQAQCGAGPRLNPLLV